MVLWAALLIVLFLNYQAWMSDYSPPPLTNVSPTSKGSRNPGGRSSRRPSRFLDGAAGVLDFLLRLREDTARPWMPAGVPAGTGTCPGDLNPVAAAISTPERR